MTSWFAFAGCNKPKIDQGGRDKQLAYRTGLLVSLWFGEVCKRTTSMDLLKSYEIDECSSQELVETSKESLLGNDDCAVANFFRFDYQIPREHQRQIPPCARCFPSLSCGLPGLKFGMLQRLTLQIFQANDSIKVQLT